jgi:hypothetical protein
MEDTRQGEEGGLKQTHPLPRKAIALTATPERTPPKIADMVTKGAEAAGVGRDRVVGEVASNHLG